MRAVFGNPEYSDFEQKLLNYLQDIIQDIIDAAQ